MKILDRHIDSTSVSRNGKPIPVFTNETCMYLMDIMQELATISVSEESFTFRTPLGKIIFDIYGPKGTSSANS